MKITKSLVIIIALVAGPVHADEADSQLQLDSFELDPIVVVASKRPRSLTDIAGQVTVIDAAYIQQYLVENIDEMFRYEPGITLEGSGTRFGANAVNIRGIGGNRVAIEIDGIPARDRFAIGNFSDAGRTFSETDRIKRVEVLYGPASTLYGSDALGGVMAVTTWDPDDLLINGNGDSWYSLRTGFKGANDSMVGSGLAAWGKDRNGVIFAATWRDGHELKNQAPKGIANDEQDWNSRDYFLRFTHDTTSGDRLRFTVQDYSRETTSEISSLPGNGRFRNTTSLKGDDSDKNRRLAFDYRFTTSRAEGVIRVFDVSSSTKQLTFEERAKGRKPVLLERQFQYDQGFRGLELNLFRAFSTTCSEHRLSAGIEFQRTDSKEIRDGYQQSLIDGAVSKNILGEMLPVRDFPNSRTDELGVFIQDEISIGNGHWELVPALRYDHYDLNPKPDDIYLDDNPVTDAVHVKEQHISPRLGALYHVNESLSIYAQYANGFRAPPFEDANIGLDIPLFNIRAIPNPELKSETSSGFEAGFRFTGISTRLSLALFNTNYEDFIETKALVGMDSSTGTLLFQSRNINRARIYGLDFRLQQALGEWRTSLDNWSINLAAYWSRGENEESGQALNSVSPPQMVLGLNWNSEDQRLGASLTGTFTGAQNRADETAGERFRTPSWKTIDLATSWKINEFISLSTGIFNITNETYWRWSDVSLFSPDNPMIELLSRPGRNYSVSARIQW